MVYQKIERTSEFGKNRLKKSIVFITVIMLISVALSVCFSTIFAEDTSNTDFTPVEGSTRGSTAQAGTSQWNNEVMWSGPDKLSGVTIGDLDPKRDGNEVIGVDGIGRVILIHRTDSGTWDSVQLWQGQGELITPVIGDFYDGHKGNELLVVGMAMGPEGEGAGQATMIYGSGDNWKATVIYINTDSMLHGAAVGEMDPTRDGKELVVMSFGFDVILLTWNGTKETDWSATHIWHAEGKVRKGIIDDFDPAHDGNELVVVDKSGNCTMINGSGNNWTAKTLFTDNNPPGLARIAVGDADKTYPGKELVVGGDSNNVAIIRRTGNTWDGEVIFTDSDKIRGVGIGDVDPTNPRNEIVVFGYSNKVTLLTGSGNNWKSRTIFVDTGRAHDLAVGEFDPKHDGVEIVIGGYSKNVTMIHVSDWFYDVMWSGPDKLSGVTIGDLDPTRDGNEVIGVDGIGRVVLVHRTTSGTWDNVQLWQGQGELITPVIGDFYDGHDGNELLVVGMAMGPEGEGAGQATMIYGSGDNWKSTVIYINSDSMLHGAAVGELDPTREGKELVVMSFGFDVILLTWNGTKETDWSATHIWHAEGKVRKGIIDDFDPTHDGNELVVVDKSGNCTMITGSGNNWTAKTLFTDNNPPGLARIAVGDADRAYPGKELVVGGDSNNVAIVRRTGNTWDGEVIFTDSDKIRGVGIGDIDPTNPWNEIVVFGYSNKVTLLTGSGSNWQSHTIFVDAGRSHDLALGEFDPKHIGQEIVIGGYSNNVTMIFNSQITTASDYNIYGYPTSQTGYYGSTVEFTIGLLSLGGFNDNVQFSATGIPNWVSYKFYPESIIPDSSTKLSLDIPVSAQSSEVDFTITATSGELSHDLSLHLSILGDTVAPSVSSTIPTDKAEEVPTLQPIIITFTEPIDSQTLTSDTISIIEDSTKTEYTGTFDYIPESNMLMISEIHEKSTPENTLPHSKLIKITLDTSIKDLAGNQMESKYKFDFITSSTSISPNGILEIKYIYPGKDDSNIPNDSPIVVQFSVPMDESTLTWDNIEIVSSDGIQYTGTINYDSSSFTMTITDIALVDGSSQGFRNDSKITLKLKTGILTKTGEPLSSPFETGFEIGAHEDTPAKVDDDDLKAERDMYQLGLILAIVLIILLILALAMKGKRPEEPLP